MQPDASVRSNKRYAMLFGTTPQTVEVAKAPMRGDPDSAALFKAGTAGAGMLSTRPGSRNGAMETVTAPMLALSERMSAATRFASGSLESPNSEYANPLHRWCGSRRTARSPPWGDRGGSLPLAKEERWPIVGVGRANGTLIRSRTNAVASRRSEATYIARRGPGLYRAQITFGAGTFTNDHAHR